MSIAHMQEQDRCEAREEAQRATEIAASMRAPSDGRMLAARMPKFFLMYIQVATNLSNLDEAGEEDPELETIARTMSAARAEAINLLKMHDKQIEEMKRERSDQVADLEKKMLAIQLEQGAVCAVPAPPERFTSSKRRRLRFKKIGEILATKP